MGCSVFCLHELARWSSKRLGKVSVLTRMIKYDTIHLYGHYVCHIEHL